MLRRKISLLALLMAALLASIGLLGQEKQMDTAAQGVGHVLVLRVDGAIGPATVNYIANGLQQAETENAELLVLQLDTPGGLDASMRDINKAILAAKVPVAIYVSPAGARAASAGTYMLYASHIAAMAPGTNLGAATPVQMGGMPSGDDKPEKKPAASPQEQNDKVAAKEEKQSTAKTAMERKMENDAAAYLRSLAELRGRNVEWAEQAVRQAHSLSADEALQKNVIDFIAEDIAALLRKTHGRTVKTEAGEKRLQTAAARVEYEEPDWRIKLLATLTDPNIAYFLMLLGFYGLIYEFMNPGFVLPGVVGAICLVLALYAFQVLPINYAGFALILLGLGFMAAEAFVPSFGILGIGGLIAFTVGSVILLDEKGYAISIPMIAGNALISAVFFIWILGMVVRIRRKPAISGVNELLNVSATAVDDFAGRGRVQLRGELWNAVCDSGATIRKHEKLRIIKVDGLLLHVEPIK